LWRCAERLDGVVVAAEFPVGSDGRGLALPFRALGALARHRAEGGDGPRRRLVGDFAAQLGGALVGCLGERGEVGVPLGVVGARHPLRERLPDGVEPAFVGDPRVQDVRGVAGVGEGAVGDRLVQDLAGVVAGEFGPT